MVRIFPVRGLDFPRSVSGRIPEFRCSDCPDTVRNRDDSRKRTFLRENGTPANPRPPNALRRWAKKVSGHSRNRTVSERPGTGRFWGGSGTKSRERRAARRALLGLIVAGGDDRVRPQAAKWALVGEKREELKAE